MNILEKAAVWLLPNLAKRSLDSRYPAQYNLLVGGTYSTAGKQVGPRTSIGLPSVYHAVNLLSQDYASLPHRVYSYSTSGKDILTDHNAHRLLTIEPNYFQTPFEFLRTLAVHRLMYGNCYAVIQRLGGSSQIQNLIPVHPDYVTDIIDVEQELFYQVRGYDDLISQNDMIHVRDLQINDDECEFMGKSRIDACREAIGQGLAVQEYTSRFYGNGANVGKVFESEEGALEDAEQRKALLNSLKDYQGPENSHQPIVLPWGVKMSAAPTQFTQEQSQFIETKIHFVEEVAQIFNIPLHKMRIDNDGNSYNSVEQANIDYINDCLKPFAIAFEQEFNRKLFINDRGQACVMASTKEKRMSDLKGVSDYVDKMVKAGVFSINKALETIGENTIGEEGDHRFIPVNMVPLDKIGEYGKKDNSAGAGGQTD